MNVGLPDPGVPVIETGMISGANPIPLIVIDSDELTAVEFSDTRSRKGRTDVEPMISALIPALALTLTTATWLVLVRTSISCGGGNPLETLNVRAAGLAIMFTGCAER